MTTITDGLLKGTGVPVPASLRHCDGKCERLFSSEMAKKKTSEQEFQGDVVTWLNEEIKRRSSIGLDRATQEPSKITQKRSDVVVWWNRAAVSAFFSIELKTPETPITDFELLNDATAKAQSWNAPYFVIWNSKWHNFIERQSRDSQPRRI